MLSRFIQPLILDVKFVYSSLPTLCLLNSPPFDLIIISSSVSFQLHAHICIYKDTYFLSSLLSNALFHIPNNDYLTYSYGRENMTNNIGYLSTSNRETSGNTQTHTHSNPYLYGQLYDDLRPNVMQHFHRAFFTMRRLSSVAKMRWIFYKPSQRFTKSNIFVKEKLFQYEIRGAHL